jgi:catechol-2,3-dioxygenase
MYIDHINIKAPQPLLEQVRDFYCSVLGLEEGSRPAFSSTGHWLYAGDQPLVHLSLDASMPAPGTPGHLDHVAFRCSGLRNFKRRLDALRIEYRTSHIEELNLTQLFLRDPAGNGLEVNFKSEVTM